MRLTYAEHISMHDRQSVDVAKEAAMKIKRFAATSMLAIGITVISVSTAHAGTISQSADRLSRPDTGSSLPVPEYPT
jgi:hypothetical protein